MSVHPVGRTVIVYDHNDQLITACVQSLIEFMNIYSLNIEQCKLDEWGATTDYGSDKVLFFVSVDTEPLNGYLIRKVKSYSNSKILMLLTYSIDGIEDEFGLKDLEDVETIVQSAVEEIKGVWQNATAKVHTVRKSDRLDESDWWPHVLVFLSDNDRKNANRNNAEFGVYYYINTDRLIEYEWFERQRKFLEEELHVKCAVNDSATIDDIGYASNCTCVAMFLSRTRQLKVDHLIRLVKAPSCTCQFRIFVEKLDPSYIKLPVSSGYVMEQYGEGAMWHWFGILSDLGIGPLDRGSPIDDIDGRMSVDSYVTSRKKGPSRLGSPFDDVDGSLPMVEINEDSSFYRRTARPRMDSQNEIAAGRSVDRPTSRNISNIGSNLDDVDGKYTSAPDRRKGDHQPTTGKTVRGACFVLKRSTKSDSRTISSPPSIQ